MESVTADTTQATGRPNSAHNTPFEKASVQHILFLVEQQKTSMLSYNLPKALTKAFQKIKLH